METEVFVHLKLLSCITISNGNNIWKAMRNEEGRESTKLLKSWFNYDQKTSPERLLKDSR